MKRLILTIILSVLPIAVNADDIMSWGDDTFGQVTDSPSDSGNQAFLPWHRGYFIDLAGGENHSLALRADGTLVSWGDDTYRQVGDTPAGDDYVAVSTGQNHSLALKADGTLMSWGDDSWGQVSNAPPGNDYVAISGGAFSSLALKADGSIDGGNSDAYNHASSVPTGTGFAAVAAGAFHGLALKDNGTLVSWASDDYGQVSQTPIDGDYVAIAAGWWHSLALKDNGTLVSWGYDSSGQVSQTPPGNDFVAVKAGRQHSLALKADGSLISWGDDGSGQVSQNPGSTYNVFTAIAAGGDHSLALRAPPLIFEEDFEGGASDWVSAIVGPGIDDMSGGHDDGAYISLTADIDTSGGGDDGFYPVARCAVAPASWTAPSQNCSDGDLNGDWYFTKGIQELRFWFRHNSAKPGGLQPAIRVATPGNSPAGLAVFPAVAAYTWTQNTVQIDSLDPAWDSNWGASAGSVPDAVAVFRDVGRLQVGYYVDPNDPAGGPSLDAIQDQVFTPACSFCHSGGTGSGGLPASLDLSSASASFTSLVGVESLQVMGVDLVVPGDPDGSYLIQKLEDANGIGGSQMPRNSAPLDQSVIDDVRLWISNGPAYAESNATFDFDDVQIRGVDVIPAVVDVITGGGQHGHGHGHRVIHLNHEGGPDAITGLDDKVRLMVFGAATEVGDPVSLDTDDIVASSVRIGRLGGAHIDGEERSDDHDSDGLGDAEFAVLTGDAFGRAALAEGSCQAWWAKPNEVAFRAELATGQIIAGEDTIIARTCNAQCHP